MIDFEPIGRIGTATQIYITLLTDQLLRVPADPSELSIVIYDFEWRDNCQSTVHSGLYPGNFVAEILCTKQSVASNELLLFTSVYQDSI